MSLAGSVGCPLCGRDEPDPLFRAGDPDRPGAGPYLLARCTGCRLVFVHPPPSDQETSDAYRKEFYRGPTAFTRGVFTVGQRLLLLERVRLVRRFATRGALLDVGCGDGAFLERLAREGFAAAGVEASDAAAARARARGLQVAVGNLEDLPFPPASFSTITLYQVLEHLAHPRLTLTSLRGKLRPDGTLIVSVPNFAGLDARLFGKRWFHLDVPRHRVHFEPGTLTGLLDSCGFAIIHATRLSWEYNPFSLLQSTLNLALKPNHLYRLLRRGASPWRAPLATAASLAAAAILTPAALAVATLAALLGHGASLTVVARPRQA